MANIQGQIQVGLSHQVRSKFAVPLRHVLLSWKILRLCTCALYVNQYHNHIHTVVSFNVIEVLVVTVEH